MVLTKTPICNFGEKPHSFTLKGVDNKLYKFDSSCNKIFEKVIVKSYLDRKEIELA